MNAKVGQYFFGRYHGLWSVWQYTVVNENGTCANRVPDTLFACAKNALDKVYELNGWGKPRKYGQWMIDEYERYMNRSRRY